MFFISKFTKECMNKIRTSYVKIHKFNNKNYFINIYTLFTLYLITLVEN